ncbi:MAG: 1-acyl-sn-glycerol-3-phosphate acyltransferase [Nostocaceae cyanobacterium]|nr:1-acyl-sn-glycerol-3-phosphate acyltransferase [Nostocaceae cyanobacterium]
MPRLNRVHPRLEFIPQHFNPLVRRLTQLCLPILLRFRLRPWLPAGIAGVELVNAEMLADLYHQFQTGKIRLLIAFRHPEVDDPLCMFHMFSQILPRVARKRGIILQHPTHTHFIYDRGMTIWAGDWLGCFFSRLGGIPIHRGKKLDRTGLRTARDLLINGKFPMTIAPEGATNGHSESVSALEPGLAQLGFWCVQDLIKANREEEVLVVPIGIQYHYIQPPWSKLDWLLSKLEADSGLPVERIGDSGGNQEDIFYQRLFRLGEYLITQMEEFYGRFYHQNLPETDPSTNANQALEARLKALLDASLKVAEQLFGIQPQGTIIDRCRLLEEAGWNYIYREDIPDLKALSPLHRGMADWIAAAADMHIQHMRLVESFVAVSGTYVKDKPTPERFAETALIIFDMIERIKGIKSPRRPRLGWRQATLTVGEPISVTKRWSNYKGGNRQSARLAVTDLTQDLQKALEKMIS